MYFQIFDDFGKKYKNGFERLAKKFQSFGFF